MAKDFLAWAFVNPMSAIALLLVLGGVLIGVLVALWLVLPRATQAAREWRTRRNGNGHTSEMSKPDPPASDPQLTNRNGSGRFQYVTQETLDRHIVEAEQAHDDLDVRIEVFENLTNKGERLKAHFEQGHKHAGILQTHTGELERGGRKIQALGEHVQKLGVDFAEHRGEVNAKLDGLDTGQLRILEALRKLGAT